jgi:hypothetical protein
MDRWGRAISRQVSGFIFIDTCLRLGPALGPRACSSFTIRVLFDLNISLLPSRFPLLPLSSIGHLLQLGQPFSKIRRLQRLDIAFYQLAKLARLSRGEIADRNRLQECR